MRVALLLFVLACGSKSSPPSQPSAPPAPIKPGDCSRSGCSGTVCAEPGNEVVTTCEFKPEYACYRDAAGGGKAGAHGGGTTTPRPRACRQTPPPADAGGAPQ